jgi:hypothetical protein
MVLGAKIVISPLNQDDMAIENSELTLELDSAALLAQKDEALVEQGMRLAQAQSAATLLQNQNATLQQELQKVKLEAAEKQRLVDEQAAEVARMNAGRVSNNIPASSGVAAAPNGGYGMHLASFQKRESIAPGLNDIRLLLPVITNGRPVKIAAVTVNGVNYFRLILGQFDRQSDAVATCVQAKLLVEFCNTVAFEGEDF